jgi:KDO2-lipid IV(A) lauroyltransferase
MPDIGLSLRRCRRRLTFLTMRRLMRVTGFASARRLGSLFGDIQFRFAWRQRQRCLHDLAQLLGRPGGDPWVRVQLRQAYRLNAVALLETLAMFDRRQDERVLDRQCEVVGSEHLRAALALGHGAILLAAHMGNCALLATHLAFSGWPVSVVYRRARMMSADFFERGLPLYGIEGISANAGIHAYARMLDALRRGRILFVMMDQGTKAAQDGIILRFLGKNMPISAGPAQLARHSGAPLLVASTTAAEPVWRFSITAPLARAAEASLESEVEFLARLTEQQILQYPHLWSWHQRRWRKYPMVEQ